ncbi:outer membrane protein [Melioribacteraceae bacterium 4301-Me]|uniref:outer membrane protein n=1 Tax=Pyranulibacter aquaticus TaxID=3163344 RepID=UPI00359BB6F5
MKKLSIIILFIITCGAINYAQSIGIGPQIGYYKSQDADNPSAMLGVALRVKLTNSLGIEGSINYKKEEFANGNVKTTSYPLMATALIYFIPIVYGTAGAGWYNVKYEYSASYKQNGLRDETTQKFGYHFGGGVELPFGNVTLIGDIRYVFLNLKLDNLPVKESLKSNFYVITAGILFKI